MPPQLYIDHQDTSYLQWEGREAYRTRMPAPCLLEPAAELSHGEPAGNLVIEGDNLQVMASLQGRYEGTIDVAYLDPPYNTGDHDFAYSARRSHDPDADADDFAWVGNEDDGRHAKWLDYMGPRLWMTWRLLGEHGVCLVSINQIELFRLGMLMDEIFGERNRIGTIVWKHGADNARNNRTRIAAEHEHVLCYAKDAERLRHVTGPPRSVIELAAHGAADTLRRLLPAHPASERFEDAKPVELIAQLLAAMAGEDALVLDPFAGSGTTGHAVLRLNAEDGGRRRFILIEEGSREDPCCRTLLAPRLMAAIKAEALPGGFAFETKGRRL